MNMKTIAKTSLALGLLTTGAITVTTQSVKAEKIQSTKVDKVPTLKAERLAMINITAGANTGQRKQLTQDKNACLNSKRHQILMRKKLQFPK